MQKRPKSRSSSSKKQKLNILGVSYNCLTLQEYDLGSEVIGRGAYSFVYKVKHRKKGYFAALKVIDSKKIKSKAHLDNLTSEILLHHTIKHQNVVKLQKCFRDASNFYLLMEYCEKGELFKSYQQKKLDIHLIKKFAQEIAQGLEYVHSQNIIHRDLKPGNIFVTSDDQIVKIILKLFEK